MKSVKHKSIVYPIQPQMAPEMLSLLKGMQPDGTACQCGCQGAAYEKKPICVAEIPAQNLAAQRARRRGQLRALGNGYYSAAKGALELATEALARRPNTLACGCCWWTPARCAAGWRNCTSGRLSAAGQTLTPKIGQRIDRNSTKG